MDLKQLYLFSLNIGNFQTQCNYSPRLSQNVPITISQIGPVEHGEKLTLNLLPGEAIPQTRRADGPITPRQCSQRGNRQIR